MHLYFHQISSVLSSLEKFFEDIEPEVDAISGEESDTQAFMKLMSIFNRVCATLCYHLLWAKTTFNYTHYMTLHTYTYMYMYR